MKEKIVRYQGNFSYRLRGEYIGVISFSDVEKYLGSTVVLITLENH